MKVLYFDESASETNNNFHHGINVTVRKGTKYQHELNIGERVKIRNLQEETIGEANVTFMFVGRIDLIPLVILQYEHDPKCREINGLIEVLQNCYDDPQIDFTEVVTAIGLDCDFQRG